MYIHWINLPVHDFVYLYSLLHQIKNSDVRVIQYLGCSSECLTSSKRNYVYTVQFNGNF